jgi:hypothetical protein
MKHLKHQLTWYQLQHTFEKCWDFTGTWQMKRGNDG